MAGAESTSKTARCTMYNNTLGPFSFVSDLLRDLSPPASNALPPIVLRYRSNTSVSSHGCLTTAA